MYKAVKKTKAIRRYKYALEIHTGAPTLHWEENTSYIYVIEARMVIPAVKKIHIPVCFLQGNLTTVFLLKNTRSPVSCRHICAPNHAVQL